MTKKKKDERLGWHFLPISRELGYSDGRKAKLGKTMSSDDWRAPHVCNTGMHASGKPIDAFNFLKGPIMCRVLVSRDLDGINGQDQKKFCGRDRTVLWCSNLLETISRSLPDTVGLN